MKIILKSIFVVLLITTTCIAVGCSFVGELESLESSKETEIDVTEKDDEQSESIIADAKQVEDNNVEPEHTENGKETEIKATEIDDSEKNDEQSEMNINQVDELGYDTKKVEVHDEPIYIVLKNAVLGTFENGDWNSIQLNKMDRNMINSYSVIPKREVLVDEVSKQTYHLYTQHNKIGESNEFTIPDFNHAEVLGNFKIGDNYIYNDILAISKEFNPLPKSSVKHIDIMPHHMEAVRNILDNHNLTATEVNIYELVSTDIDNDGVREVLIIAQSTDESGSPVLDPADRFVEGSGAYTTALLIKNNDLIPLYFEGHELSTFSFNENDSYVPYGIDSCINTKLLGFFDLNNDGSNEICIETKLWDVPEIRVFALDSNGQINEVLYGMFGW